MSSVQGGQAQSGPAGVNEMTVFVLGVFYAKQGSFFFLFSQNEDA